MAATSKRARTTGVKEPPRLVAIGDLNGADDALEQILRGTGLIDRAGRWVGGKSELVQVGDLFNRGAGAKQALTRLIKLRAEAGRVGGRVTVLLGNHEVMTALRHEAYCTEDEYLAFATAAERRAWPARVRRAMLRLFRDHGPRGPVRPIAPRLEAWKLAHVPGQSALRRALGPRTKLGRALRELPVAHVAGDTIFVHAGILPEWANLGVDGLNQAAKAAWQSAPAFYPRLPAKSLFRSNSGPLWDRSLAYAKAGSGAALRRSLALLGVRRMVVGHTPTDSFKGGERGKIALIHGGRLVLIDVGLCSGSSGPRTALVIEGRTGREWTPHGTRVLWRGGAG
jgi:hypothetical protein